MASEGHLVGELEEELGNVRPLFSVNDTPKVPLRGGGRQSQRASSASGMACYSKAKAPRWGEWHGLGLGPP